MKRIFALLTAFIFLLCSHPAALIYASDGPVFSAAYDVPGARGQPVTVPITVSGNPNPGFTAVGFMLTYDSSVLRITDVSAPVAAMPLNEHFAITSTQGTQRIHLINPNADNWNGNGIVVNIIFDVSSTAPSGRHPVTLTFMGAPGKPDGRPVNVEEIPLANASTSSGSVLISGSTPSYDDTGGGDDGYGNTWDLSRPNPSAILPRPESTGHPTSGEISIGFGRPMNTSYNVIYINGVRYTGTWNSTRTVFTVRYYNLEPGWHTVRVPGNASEAFRTTGGSRQEEYEWRFRIDGSGGSALDTGDGENGNGEGENESGEGANAGGENGDEGWQNDENSGAGDIVTHISNNERSMPGSGEIIVTFPRPILDLGEVYLNGEPQDIGWGNLSGGTALSIPYNDLSDGLHDVLLSGFGDSEGLIPDYFFQFAVGEGSAFIGSPGTPPDSGGSVTASRTPGFGRVPQTGVPDIMAAAAVMFVCFVISCCSWGYVLRYKRKECKNG